MKKISLTSFGYKLLAIICTLGILALTISVCFFTDEFYVIAIIFSLIVSMFCLFALFLCFNHKVYIKNDKLILKQIRTVKIELSEIKSIQLNDKSLLNDNTIFIYAKNEIYRLSGFNSLKGKKKRIGESQKIIMNLQNLLNLK